MKLSLEKLKKAFNRLLNSDNTPGQQLDAKARREKQKKESRTTSLLNKKDTGSDGSKQSARTKQDNTERASKGAKLHDYLKSKDSSAFSSTAKAAKSGRGKQSRSGKASQDSKSGSVGSSWLHKNASQSAAKGYGGKEAQALAKKTAVMLAAGQLCATGGMGAALLRQTAAAAGVAVSTAFAGSVNAQQASMRKSVRDRKG